MRKKYLELFLTLFKIGLFTFGGGYAMIALLENEFVDRKKWLKHDEFMDIIVIAESTPGPIAVNSATYIGYKMAGVFGSAFATLGVCLPSFMIIYIISLFFDAFISLTAVAAAFKGIQACVVYLILSAGIKMFKKMDRNPLSITLLTISTICLVGFSLFAIKFSSIYYILAGGFVGVVTFLIKKASKEDEK
ncbi:MAG: chromate transporter [Clostridia bacterium]|nr:chromate transporter [Clostridia bacterium]